MQNYRKIYADYYGIKWDSKLFEVHHIDRNRENNDIKNLVLLPKKLHREYHRIISVIEFDFQNGADIFNASNYDIYHAKEYQQLFDLKFDIAILDLLTNQYKIIGETFNINDFNDIIKYGANDIYKKYTGETKWVKTKDFIG